MARHAAIGMAILCSTAAHAGAAHTYGDTLAATIARADPAITGITIDATGKDGAPIHIARGRPSGRSISAPLNSATGELIGVITVSARRLVDAAAVARRAARRIYVADNLAEPDPFVVGAVRSEAAQAIVDAMIDSDPDLVTLAMHVALPGADNTIIASNFGRIGKRADNDDADVITNGSIRQEVTNAGRRLAVELPMLDAHRRVIGALSTSFTMTGPADRPSVLSRAVSLRDAIARRIPSIESLAGR